MKRNQGSVKRIPPPQVIALYDHDPLHNEVQHENLPAFIAPDVSVQLSFRRGEKFEVIGKELDWWLRCRSLSSGKEGYVPTVYLAPLRAEPDVNKSISRDVPDGDSEKKAFINEVQDHKIDSIYFPNAPHYKKKKPCPESKANIFSILTFWWLTRLMIDGFKKPLTDLDLWELDEHHKTKTLLKKFDQEWQKEIVKWQKSPLVEEKRKSKKSSKSKEKESLVNGKASVSSDGANDQSPTTIICHGYKPSISKVLIKVFGSTYVAASIFKLIHDSMQFVNPYLLGKLIVFVKSDTEELKWGYIYACCLLLSVTCQSFALHQYFQRVYVVAMNIRSSLLAIVYKKMLKLSVNGCQEFTVGGMVNLMTVDVQKCSDLFIYVSLLWSGPLQVIGSLVFLGNLLGWSIIAGFVILLLLIPLNMCISRLEKKFHQKQMIHKDSRSKLMNELLAGIKIIKLYAWEDSFLSKVMGVRVLELNQLKKSMYLAANNSFTLSCTPFLVSCATFTVYVLVGNELTAQKAFVAISLFNIIRFPLFIIPMVVSNLMQYVVSVKRLSNFLRGDEINYADVTRLDSSVETAYAVEIKEGCFTWRDPEKPVLSNVNMQIPHGNLIAIVGQVGCGKTSMLSSILGEIHKVNGEVMVQGKIAYVPQQAWIKNETLQDNILFGKTMLQQKYNNIIKACALQPDLDVLQAGDMTEIGEKGINLSGGQKQRVSLARAVYNNADIYLLDDPLSAVDAHVGKHIFNHVIGPNGLLKNKTRVLVTHHISFLPAMDRIVVLKNGCISELGSYEELVKSDGDFADFLRTYHNRDEESVDVKADKECRKEDQWNPVKERSMTETSLLDQPEVEFRGRSSILVDENLSASMYSLYTGGAADNNEEMAVQEILNEHDKTVKILKQDVGNIIHQEKSETGRVKRSVFLTYAKSLGVLVTLVLILGGFLAEGSLIGSRMWLAEWSDQLNTTDSKRDFYLGVYGGLGLLQAFCVLFQGYAVAYGSFQASRTLHDNLLKNILHCPMSFFESTPMGRIINRFSKDINVIDDLLPRNVKMFTSTFMTMLGTIFIISYSTPLFLAVLLPVGAMYFLTQRFYVASSRQLKRIESVKRSPIYNHFFESINGATTIRAYQYQEKFLQENALRIDSNQEAYFPAMTSNRWLAMRLELCGNLVTFFAALFCIIQKGDITAGIAGLSISYSLQVTQTLNWLVRQSSELETNIISVERVKDYIDQPTEAASVIPNNRPSDDWPASGVVEFDAYSVRYREELDLVLKELQFTVQPSEKIGIVGRTGAGKSSLALALFRVLESAAGKIYIDGVDIASIGLKDLRSRLTIIPQDPVLFAGTLRFNLDPFNQFDDGELWKALEVARLKTFVSGVEGGLDYEATENGENLSVGQRQLVCLARALLRKTKILLLDEATASVDLETDSFIQQTIREEFQNCTILTIAHRLNTIIDYDRILVLNEGVVVEFDTPAALLIKKNGIFYSMVRDAGLLGSVSF